MNNEKTNTQIKTNLLLALNELFGDMDDDTEEAEDDTEAYNEMLTDLNTNEALKTLVYRLVPHKDQEDAWSEILLQVALIKDRETVLRLWKKPTKEFHWYMVRVICNQLKSKTSHFYRKYRRPDQKLDDNSHTIISVANDIGQGHELVDGYVLDSIENKLTHRDKTSDIMDNEMIMAEVNWFVSNYLTFYEREIYKMYYEEEMSHVKISKATMIPATSIGNTVRKVLSMIQDHLTSQGIVKDNNTNN